MKDEVFESIYRLYPKKMGKSKGLQKYKKQVKTEKDQNDLKRAIHSFIKYHENRGTEEQFIPYFSTFMTSWRDWLEDDTGSCTETKTSGHFRTQAMMILNGEI